MCACVCLVDCVRRFIVEGLSKLQIARAPVPELMRLFNQETFRRLLRDEVARSAGEILLLNVKIAQ